MNISVRASLVLPLAAAALFLSVSSASAQFVAQDPRLLRMEDPRLELNAPANEFAQPSADASLPTRLQRALDSVYALTSEDGRYGITASVIVNGQVQWNGASGISEPGVPLRSDHLVEIASNTKTFITAAILQLEEEGKLAITDPISKYLPSFENIDTNITIKQLLEHSSGVYDYLNDDPNATLLIDAYDLHPQRVWTAPEVLASVGAPNFKAGTSFRYSNTGFTLLGMIIESVTQARVADELRRRFFDPLQLSSTFAGSDEDIFGEFAHQWIAAYDGEPARDLWGIDKTGHLSLAWTGGYIVSTPSDLARWSHALYRGKLLSPASMTKMLKMNSWPDGTRYGLGAGQVPYGAKKLYGHGGRLIGFQSMMYTMPKDSVTFVIVTNSDPLPNDVVLNDYAIAILQEIYRPVAATVSSSQPLRIYQIEGGRTLKIELPETEVLTGEVRLIDILGRTYVPHMDMVGSSARVELDAIPPGVFTYVVRSNSGTHTGRISRIK